MESPVACDATRYAFAPRACQGGMDLYRLARLGRWKSLQMVQMYAHHDTSSLKVGVEVLNKQRKNFCDNSMTVEEKKELTVSVTS